MGLVSETQFQNFESLLRGELASFFTVAGPLACARAPGRLDVMGGVADYSGGTVLEGTLAEATLAAAQQRPDGLIRVRSLSAARAGFSAEIELPMSNLFGKVGCISEDEARL